VPDRPAAELDTLHEPMTPVSIIICTYNRADSLRQTLASIDRVDVPADLTAELVVVDNASTDHTAAVVREHRPAGIPVRYIHEPRKGKPYAINRAFAQTTGSIILSTDDDVEPGREWIEAMCRPLTEGKADFVGGPIVLPEDLKAFCRSSRRLDWIADGVGGTGPEPFGSNLAFARRILDDVPGYDPEIGPGALGFHDDVLFFTQARDAGYRHVVADERGTVKHHLGRDRLTADAMRRQASGIGRSMAYFDHHYEHVAAAWSRMGLLKSLAGLAYVRLRHLTFLSRKSGLHPAEWWQHRRIGYHSQMLIERRRPRNYEKQGGRKILGIRDLQLEAVASRDGVPAGEMTR
jgi:glucosyl-dolichyl phosphate glucuronosyltransferase